MRDKPIGTYIVLFVPWLISLGLSPFPVESYLIAWLGSFFIFYMTLTGKLRKIPEDRTVAEQLMRPIFLPQIIFAGFMCCTSIFYFLDVLGYQDFKKVSDFYIVDSLKLSLTAQCQRYCCLGHAALASGIMAFMRYPVEKKYYIEKGKLANLLLMIALITLPVTVALSRVSGLSQFANQLTSLSFVAGTLALAFAIPLKKVTNTAICVVLYFSNFYSALTSGFKEPIIISVLVLGVFLYPNYKRLITLTFIPALLALFVLLPTYNRVFRQNSWYGESGDDAASQMAINAVLNRDDSDDTNWAFYAFRLSEMDMFNTFVWSTPDHVDYYGTKLLQQSITVLVPRIFWPGKPITEAMIMERVYNAGVVNRGSTVSAKPSVIVDAYLSGGPFGVFFYLFLYGAITQLISIKAETLFGGYLFGTALIFSGLFQMLWRGLSFEFLINSVFWSYITMLIIFRILKAYNILKQV